MTTTEDKNTFRVEREATIGAPSERIYEKLSDFHRWTEWSPWEDLDPNLQRTYSGPESGVGAIYAWKGNSKAGQGRMEIVEANEPKDITIQLDFLKPFKSSNTTVFRLTPDGDATRVTWTMTGPRTLMTKIMGIFKSMDKMIGPDFEKGLTQLKKSVAA